MVDEGYKYEFVLIELLPDKVDQTLDTLNQKGRNGWHVVGCIHNNIIIMEKLRSGG